jgi:hypothetical protein
MAIPQRRGFRQHFRQHGQQLLQFVGVVVGVMLFSLKDAWTGEMPREFTLAKDGPKR